MQWAPAVSLLSLLALPHPVLAQKRPPYSAGHDSTYVTVPVGKAHIVAWLYQGNSQVELTTWRDASSAGFEVQQSADQRHWKVLARMDAYPLRADSTSYVYLDLKPQRYGVPVVYYRMRQIAQGGQFTYSPTYPVWLQAATAAN